MNGTAIPSDNSTFTSLMAQISSLAFDACYDYKGEADTLSACGLDTPVGVLTVAYGEGETLTLAIGTLDGAGESRYAQLSGDPAVYLLPADSVDTLISLRPGAHRGGGGRGGDGLGRKLQQRLLTTHGTRPRAGAALQFLQNCRLKNGY